MSKTKNLFQDMFDNASKFDVKYKNEIIRKYQEFSSIPFTPRNELDATLYDLMKRNLQSVYDSETHGTEFDFIDSSLDNILTANGVPEDNTAECWIDTDMFCRDWFIEEFYEYNPSAIFKITDEILTYKRDSV